DSRALIRCGEVAARGACPAATGSRAAWPTATLGSALKQVPGHPIDISKFNWLSSGQKQRPFRVHQFDGPGHSIRRSAQGPDAALTSRSVGAAAPLGKLGQREGQAAGERE